MGETYFTKDDMWICFNSSEEKATVGITENGLKKVGDELMCILLPETDKTFTKDSEIGYLDGKTEKLVFRIPVSGTVTDVNMEVIMSLWVLKGDCRGKGWLVKVKPSDTSEFSNLMDEQKYKQYLES